MIKKFVFVMFIIAAVACMSYADSKKPGFLPPDAYGSCLVKDFSQWQNQPGVFNAANSVMFEGKKHCDFYKWSWHMFLWLTSWVGDELVYNSDSFFNVIPDKNDGLKLAQEGQSPRLRDSKEDEFTAQAMSKGVLMSQMFKASIAPDGSLVYYSVHVNDVYAYFLSMVKKKNEEGKKFPTTPMELNTIKNYAKKNYNVDIKNGKALAMELKTSWVKVANNENAKKNYITITADIPEYVKDKSNTELTWDGSTMEKDVTLALVGFHVVGSVKGHPEMIWATFEHMDNAPNGNYTYFVAPPKNEPITIKKTIKSFNSDGTLNYPKNWLFFGKDGNKNMANKMRMHQSGDKIIAPHGKKIGPSNTYLVNAWGGGTVENNTEIISISNNIHSLLPQGDVRKNYALIGAIWTENGTIPPKGNNEGSTQLANSTMETYVQPSSCFSCHETSGKKTWGDLRISHIFKHIKPLKK